MTLLGSNARRLRAELVAAPDATVARIVAMLDTLESRGDADDILAGVRPRLRLLRPARPMRLPRVLALPLEGALVSPTAWTQSNWEIPRSALAPLLAAVRDALGEEWTGFEAACAGHEMENDAAVAAIGDRLWRKAGAATLDIRADEWDRTGMSADAARLVTALAAALWRHGPALFSARQQAADGPPEAVLRAALAPLASEGAGAIAAATLFILRDAAAPARVASVASELAPTMVRVALRAVGNALAVHSAAIGATRGTGEMADYAEALLERMDDADENDHPLDREARRQERLGLRREAAATCVARFAADLQTEVAKHATALMMQPSRASDQAVHALENTARNLRRLERAGRRLGETKAFDRALGNVTETLLLLADMGHGLSWMDLARLVEIIAGTEAALQLLPRLPGR